MGARRGWRTPLVYAAWLAVALPLGGCSGDPGPDELALRHAHASGVSEVVYHR